MKSIKFLILAALVFSSFCLLAAEEIPTYQTLKERRPTLQFPHYSVEQKKLVLSQVKLVLGQIFVHRDLKIKDFGVSADPLPYLNEIEKNIQTISDYNFHKQIAEVFFKQRDFHTGYSFPKPYACYRSIIPVSFKEVKDLNGNNVIAISSVAEKAEVIALMPDNFRVAVGDIVLSYDGLPVKQAMLNMASRSRGANPAAVFRHTAGLLTYRGQSGDVAPGKDEVVLVLKDRNGKNYTVTLPWISVANATCLKEDAPEQTLFGLKGERGSNDDQIEFIKFFRKSRLPKSLTDTDGLKETGDPILKYKKLSNEYGTFGYFKLESFVPEKLTNEGVVLEFKKILEKEFLHTSGIIIDLRDNGGGMINLADQLVQLFTPKSVAPTNFHLKNSPANVFYMESVSPNGAFTKALRVAAQIGAGYTTDIPLSRPESINRIGQSFFRPVMILTNSSCYSSCDMFSAQMQDHGAAVVFGEDTSTGAGGANNFDLASLYAELPEGNKGPFKELPGNQYIGFAFRQSVRTGLHAGELLENTGVVSDLLATPSISDLYNSSENQLKILSSKINSTVKNYPSWVKFSSSTRIDVNLNETLSFFTQWAQTDTIKYKINGKNLSEVAVEENNFSGREVAFPTAIQDSGAYTLGSAELIGFYDNLRVWRKIVNYRVIPSSAFSIPSTGFNFDLSNGIPAYLTIYNEQAETQNGWVAYDGGLQIGNDQSYVDNVHTEASAFIQLPAQPLTLNFKAGVATEKDYDFFKVIVVEAGKETVLIPDTSGDVGMKDYSFDLSAFINKKIEVRFVFDSDEGGTAKGVTVQNIALQRN